MEPVLPPPAVSADVGRHNLSVVLQAIAEYGPCSRSLLRDRTGLVGGTIGTMVDDLVSRGLVAESGQAQGKRGRPRTLLELTGDRVRTISADVSLTEITAEVRTLTGEVLWADTDTTVTEPGDVKGLVRVLTRLLDDAIEVASSRPDALITTPAVLIPGPVEADSTIATAIDLGIGRTNLHAPLARALKMPRDVVVQNNGRLGALAEYAALPSNGRPQAMAYVIGAEGLGGGVVLNGEIFTGAHGLAGEVGHISVDLNGPACQCGARGCLELYAGMNELTARADLRADSLSGVVSELVDRLEMGDPVALSAVDEAGRALAAAVGTMATYTDLDLLVLGGALSRLYEWIEPPITALIASRSRVVPDYNPKVVRARYGEDGPLRGAWLNARNSILNDPSQVPRWNLL